jgi:hypothetical protein
MADFSHVFDLSRWRARFRSEDSARDQAAQEGRAPDATIDEVGAAGVNHGFDGRPVHSPVGNGQDPTGGGTVTG